MTDPGILLDDLKDYLCITYNDERTDLSLISALNRGMSVIEDYAGGTIDYSQRGAAQQLLFDYVRYVKSQATEMFETNFHHDLMALRIQMETEMVKNADNQDESGAATIQ